MSFDLYKFYQEVKEKYFEKEAPKNNEGEKTSKFLYPPDFCPVTDADKSSKDSPGTKPTMPAPEGDKAAAAPTKEKETKKEPTARRKKPAGTKVKGSGSFTLNGPSGTKLDVIIKGGELLSGEGKDAKVVGTIDGDGYYDLDLNADGKPEMSGSLKDMNPKQVNNVSLIEKKGRKMIGGLQINKEQVGAGMVYFDDGGYSVKNGQLFRDGSKDAVGKLTVERESTGSKEMKISGVKYEYTDKDGKVHSGDLMDGSFASKGHKEGEMEMMAGEGSQLQIGKKMFGGRKKDFYMNFGGKSQKWLSAFKKKKGYIMTGGGKLSITLHRLKKEGKVKLTDEEIKMLQAVAQVESYGKVQTVNSWDSDKMSMGFKQFTAAGKLQELIQLDEATFKEYGIELDRDKEGAFVKKLIKTKYDKDTKKTRKTYAPGLKGMDKSDDLKDNVWATRFMEAGLDDKIVVKTAEKALIYLEQFNAPVKKGKPHADYFSKPVVKAIMFSMGNNRSSYPKRVIPLIQGRVKADTTFEQFMKIVKEEIVAYYGKNWKKHGNGKTVALGKAKGARIYDKISKYFGY